MSRANVNFEAIHKAWALVRPLAEKVVPMRAREMDLLVKEKTGADLKPTIMLYGMYSHGKSTLVNALLGREVADTGRSPTTYQSGTYWWEGGGCTLLDTPGIQAKAEDTRVTDAELRKCELVAFVVESGDVEAGLVWEQLAGMVAKGQKVCLVINDFDQCMEEPGRIMAIKDAFRSHLQRAARAQGFAGDIVRLVPMHVCNAKRALKARLEGKQALLAKSGILELEKELVKMASSLNLEDCATTLSRALRGLCAELRSKCALEDGNKQLALAEENLNAIKVERDRAKLAIAQELDARVARLASRLRSLFESQDKEKIIKGLSDMAVDLGEEMAPVIEREVKRSAKEIGDICRDFSAHVADIAGQAVPETGDVPLEDNALSKLANYNWGEVLGKLNFEELVKTAVVETLKQLKSWLPSLFVGKGAATFARWAGYAAKAAGWLLAVIPILLQLYNDYQAQKEAEDRARRLAQAIEDAVADTQIKLKDVITGQVEVLFSESFEKLIKELEAKVENLRKTLSSGAETCKIIEQAEAILSPALVPLGSV